MLEKHGRLHLQGDSPLEAVPRRQFFGDDSLERVPLG
jgi:hypothetical protein